MHAPDAPQCHTQHRKAHISAPSGALRDIQQVHCGTGDLRSIYIELPQAHKTITVVIPPSLGEPLAVNTWQHTARWQHTAPPVRAVSGAQPGRPRVSRVHNKPTTGLWKAIALGCYLYASAWWSQMPWRRTASRPSAATMRILCNT